MCFACLFAGLLARVFVCVCVCVCETSLVLVTCLCMCVYFFLSSVIVVYMFLCFVVWSVVRLVSRSVGCLPLCFVCIFAFAGAVLTTGDALEAPPWGTPRGLLEAAQTLGLSRSKVQR